jgi:hypothetical protein
MTVTPTTFLDSLIDALIAAGVYNGNDQTAPAAVLWTDKERQWEALLPRLRERLSLCTLGAYDPATRTGPAYYLRCLLGGVLEDRFPDDAPPILYLPGYSRQDLRAVEECPKPLRPLAELQYRGVVWSHVNGRDWTIPAFLQSKEGGLGIPVAGDNATRDAMQRALTVLTDEPVASLRAHAPLKADFFNSLLAPDEVQHLLRWLCDAQNYPSQVDTAVWIAFRSRCRQKYGFDPDKTSPLDIVEQLTESTPPWSTVWARYQEAPERYPAIPDLLDQRGPTQLGLFAEQRTASYFPQVNAEAESALREELLTLDNQLPSTVRRTLLDLDARHGHRRHWVWAKLGQSPLAEALAHLSRLAQFTETAPGGMQINAIVTAYVNGGWQVDQAVLEALESVSTAEDLAAVQAALLPLYRAWLKQGAVAFQTAVAANPAAYTVVPPPEMTPGCCLLFSDALRYDVGQRLAERLREEGFRVAVEWRLAPLPPVTATAKPAISPVADRIVGKEPSLTPVAAGSGSALRINVFRKLLSEANIQDLPTRGDLGDPSGRAWDEIGAVDQYGHQHGWQIAHHVRREIERILDRVRMLFAHGWRDITVVTDHGWLMLPGGLPKAEIPVHLTVQRKGRCAVLKAGAQTEHQTLPWHWSREVRIALAPDICCFEAGKAYEHGGLSPQECIVPLLRITADE